MRKPLVLAYGVFSYAIFFATFCYAAGFLGNLLVPKSIDSPRSVPVYYAIAVNLGLLTLFAVQHSVMARPAFKRWWTQYIPEPIERSTDVLLSSVCLALTFWLWQPIGGLVWNITNPIARGVLYAVFAAGWLIILYTSFLIDHFDLFGLRQTWLYFRGRAYTPPNFGTPGAYRFVRHPLYVGWFLAFWATPVLTVAHVFFALVTTAYILIAIGFEEHDLATTFPQYHAYRKSTPRFIPRVPRSAKPADIAPDAGVTEMA
jgi:protein-S-isoprenylcysteine O-methyltransferase Ste14